MPMPASINFAVTVWCIFLTSMTVFAELPEEVEGLPSYFEFFMKEGGQVTIPAEDARDAEIAAGEYEPLSDGRAVPDFTLPDGFGNTIRLKDYIGKKNIVLTTFRTWW